MKSLAIGAAVAATLSFGAANASTTILGADFDTDSLVTYLDQSFAEDGMSASFDGMTGMAQKSLVRMDLSALGYGTGMGESATGMITTNVTRTMGDSDYYFGIWDGTNVGLVAYFDGERVFNFTSAQPASGTGITNLVFSGATTNGTQTQGIGEAADAVVTFDLNALTLTLDAAGTSTSSDMTGLVFGSTLEFVIFMDTLNEMPLINSVTFDAASTTPVPLPAAALLFPLGATLVARRRAKRPA
ncbi:MAG: hypothetical protein AAF830_14425 [Pseudomonadota bacterium]